jgi:predicted nucleic acid-binding protein
MVIVNSTPILALHEIGRLEILQEIFGGITIPDAVRREVTAKDNHTLDGYDWIRVAEIADTSAKKVFTSALHDGEVEAILLAMENKAELIILDDKLARSHAKRLGLTVTGTAGVLLRAKSDGIIKEVAPVLNDIIQTDFYISDALYRNILRLAGE